MQYIVLKLLKIKCQTIEYQKLNFKLKILADSNYILFELKPLQQSLARSQKRTAWQDFASLTTNLNSLSD